MRACLLLFSFVFVASIRAAANDSEEVVPATFKPGKLDFKVNSSARVNVTLSGLPASNDSSAGHAYLVLLNAEDGEGTIEFLFDPDWRAEVNITSERPGRFTYFVQLDNRSTVVQGALTVHVYRKKGAEIFSIIAGWVNFFVWSISFYPQIILNHTRRSVIGLSFDYTLINLAGFLPFTIFNCLIYFPGAVQKAYFDQHPHNPIPVELNDVVFAAHAAAVCAVTAVQCFIFERGDQHITKYGWGFLAGDLGAILLAGILCAAKVISLLDFVYIFSYVKLASTLFKYIPQVYFNFRRKSTVGWSIGAIIMDIVGGLCSFLQQFVIALNYNSWVVIYGNVVKLLLALSSLLFDFIFVLQHYVFYRHAEKKRPKL